MTTAIDITGLVVVWVGICEIVVFTVWAWRDRRD